MNVLHSPFLVFQASPMGDPDSDTWVTKTTEELPDWVKRPSVLGRLVIGEILREDTDNIPLWYRAISVQYEDTAPARHVISEYFKSQIDELLSDDRSLAIKKWALFIEQDLHRLWLYRVGKGESPNRNSNLMQSLNFRLKLLLVEAAESVEAFEALLQIIQFYTENNLAMPKMLKTKQKQIQTGRISRPRQHGPSKYSNWGRDLHIAWVIFMLERAGTKPTRNDESNTTSGCDIAAEEFTRITKRPMNYETAKAIWKRYSKLKSPLSSIKVTFPTTNP